MRNRVSERFKALRLQPQRHASGRMMLILLAAVATAMLSACTVGPNYHRPAVRIPPTFTAPGLTAQAQSSSQTRTQAQSFADLPWWKVFDDPQLQGLIRTALHNNFDLRQAAERIQAARAEVGIVRSNQFPHIEANPNFSGGKSTQGIKSNIFTLAADAAFQTDFFGRFRRATQASRAELLATRNARETVALTVVSDVAGDYFLLRDLDLRLQIARNTVATQKQSVSLTELRLRHGVGAELDVLEARQVLDSANAAIPDLERQIGQMETAISILEGDDPHGIRRGKPLGIVTPNGLVWTKMLPPSLPAGLPSTLLERRPDIRQAEQKLVAANANIGVAKALFFPQISLTGSGGGAWGHSVFFGSSVAAPTAFGSYAAGLAQPLFEGGYLRNNLRYAKAKHREALIGYRQTIQQAFGEVADALIAYRKSGQVLQRDEDSVRDLRESVKISLLRYRGGAASYLAVLDSQRSLFDAELTLVQARNSQYQSLVQLYKALGGGWK